MVRGTWMCQSEDMGPRDQSKVVRIGSNAFTCLPNSDDWSPRQFSFFLFSVCSWKSPFSHSLGTLVKWTDHWESFKRPKFKSAEAMNFLRIDFLEKSPEGGLVDTGSGVYIPFPDSSVWKALLIGPLGSSGLPPFMWPPSQRVRLQWK